jgi:hypothetical protein
MSHFRKSSDVIPGRDQKNYIEGAVKMGNRIDGRSNCPPQQILSLHLFQNCIYVKTGGPPKIAGEAWAE